MIPFKAVLFDMDGVLVDSEPVITVAAVRALKEFGVDARPEDFHPFTGMGEDRFIGGVAEKYGKQYTLAMKDRAYEIYQEIIPELIKVCPGAVSLLETLKNHGIPAALASSADIVKVTANLKAAKIPENLFRAILTGNDVVNKKPFPDIYLLAAERCGIPPENCIVVEDAISGIRAAKAAGMRCIAVMTSFGRDQLLAEGADFVCEDSSGIWDCLMKMRI